MKWRFYGFLTRTREAERERRLHFMTDWPQLISRLAVVLFLSFLVVRFFLFSDTLDIYYYHFDMDEIRGEILTLNGSKCTKSLITSEVRGRWQQKKQRMRQWGSNELLNVICDLVSNSWGWFLCKSDCIRSCDNSTLWMFSKFLRKLFPCGIT